MPPTTSDVPAALAVVVDRLDKAGGRAPMGEAGAGLGARALLHIVADGNPEELRAWASANDLPAPILTALRGDLAARRRVPGRGRLRAGGDCAARSATARPDRR